MQQSGNKSNKIEIKREIDIGHLSSIFLKRFWAILLVAVLIAAGFFLHAKLFIKPTYQSHFTAYVNNKNTDTAANTSTGDLTASMGLVYVYQDIMTSRSVLERAAKACGTTYNKISGCVTATVSETAPVVTVTVETNSKRLSLQLAEKIAEFAPDKVAEVVDGSSMRIIDHPVAPNGKSSPNVSKRTFTGFLIGFAFATVLFVFRDLIYDTVQSSDDIERRYSVPVIGNIPDIYLAERAGERYGYGKRGVEHK